MQRDTLNTFMCVHFTIIALKRIGVFHIQPYFFFFFSPLIPFPAPLVNVPFLLLNTFMEHSVLLCYNSEAVRMVFVTLVCCSDSGRGELQ